ncbi:hypothetical protein GYMLUDRAFT_41245 [Collybiopsis luxurians FD-317 M1]|uniref:Timeless N-terminal domain-containing protein n=1 Tax=Collybiopsis luxurians FD-317 M1 TaxID=944289 RepID=A0A0D0CU09_9AGAR|nr:hypothetical protein GYMLUDRAFT_41245 [Collybiopsis luxurians FD-317 M1]
MDENEIIEISSESERDDVSPSDDQRHFLQPIVQGVVDALGGYELVSGTSVYRMGDQVTGCLKDLKKLWRRDETDDDRTIARIFWKTRVLPNDLVPILLETAGRGLVEDKRAVMVVDLMTAMTWPIDVAEELKELDDELDSKADYTELVASHLQYKAAILKADVLTALFGVVLPSLSKSPANRTERDGQIVNVVLHLVRNLAFIKDLPANSHLSADHNEFTQLQSKLIRLLWDSHIMQLILTVAANTDKDSLFDSWNTVALEIIYLLFRGVKPRDVAADQDKRPTDDLHRLLAEEQRSKRQILRQASTRHSRFGTTIAVKLNPNKKPPPNGTEGSADGSTTPSARSFVIHHQEGITGDTSELWDRSKKQKATRGHKVDELGANGTRTLTLEAIKVLKQVAEEFLEECFNPFLSTLLKDIRAERAKITEKDNLRLLFVAKWFLEFFLQRRASAPKDAQGGNGKNPDRDTRKHSFGLVAEVLERPWIIWVLKRMREAGEEKPKAWTELQAGIECLTQLLFLIDSMSSLPTSPTDTDEHAELVDAAHTLLHQLIYSGEVLDVASESLKTYKEGTQSLAYLNSSVEMGYVLLKMLEKWSKRSGGAGEDGVYVRKKQAGKRKGKKGTDEVPEEELPQQDQDKDDVVLETMFTFEAFEMKFAQADIAHTLLVYLSRYKEFSSSDQLKRVVSLLHRQAVKAKAEGLFFKVSTLNLFKTILGDRKSFPQDQPHKDLVNLINYILRQFFKAVEANPFLAVEAFFPKNRGNWKQFSSWEPPVRSGKGRTVEDTQFPPEVQVKKGYKWSEQVGIAIGALVESGKTGLVLWTQEILETAKAERDRIVEEVDNKEKQDGEENGNGLEDDIVDDVVKRSKLLGPSLDAQAKMTDYLIPYVSDEHAEAATKNSQLKLLFRLCKCYILDEDADELEWYIPAAILPAELGNIIIVIKQFLETPFDLEGKKASQLLSKKTRRKRRVREPSPDSDEEDDAAFGEGAEGGEGERKKKSKKDKESRDKDKERKRREKKKKEEIQYKSAQFIEDSDAEYGQENMAAFFELEKLRRERTEKRAADLGEGRSGAMKATGTKRRRKDKGDEKGDKGGRRKKRKGDPEEERDQQSEAQQMVEAEKDDKSSSSTSSDEMHVSNNAIAVEKSRPRPKPIPKGLSQIQTEEDGNESDGGVSMAVAASRGNRSQNEDKDDGAMEVAEANTGSSSRRKGRLILSDEEEE